MTGAADGQRRSRSGVRPTLCWREMDSNHSFRHGEMVLGYTMWFPRTAPPARRGTDPERDEKFESRFLHRRARRNLRASFVGGERRLSCTARIRRSEGQPVSEK